jgi:hypothetical protein
MDEGVIDSLRQCFPETRTLSLQNVMERDIVGGRLLVGELRLGNSRETMAYFASDVLKTPPFILQPQSRSLRLFSSVQGMHGVDIKWRASFAREYQLWASNPEHAKLLFNDEVLAYFGRRPGLQVMAADYRLIMFQPGMPFEDTNVESFVRQAMEVFALLEEATETALDRLAKAPPDDAILAAAQGLPQAGVLVDREIATREDVESFLSQPPPRRVPRNIRRQRLGATSALLALVGPLLAAAGLATCVAVGIFAGGSWSEDRVIPIIVGAAFTVVGGLSGFFAWRYRYRNLRLLRRGQIALAKFETIKATENYVGYEQQHLARCRLDANGREWTADCYLGERIARQARQHAKTGATIRVLYDPKHPDRILWAESLITVS